MSLKIASLIEWFGLFVFSCLLAHKDSSYAEYCTAVIYSFLSYIFRESWHRQYREKFICISLAATKIIPIVSLLNKKFKVQN